MVVVSQTNVYSLLGRRVINLYPQIFISDIVVDNYVSQDIVNENAVVLDVVT